MCLLEKMSMHLTSCENENLDSADATYLERGKTNIIPNATVQYSIYCIPTPTTVHHRYFRRGHGEVGGYCERLVTPEANKTPWTASLTHVSKYYESE